MDADVANDRPTCCCACSASPDGRGATAPTAGSCSCGVPTGGSVLVPAAAGCRRVPPASAPGSAPDGAAGVSLGGRPSGTADAPPATASASRTATAPRTAHSLLEDGNGRRQRQPAAGPAEPATARVVGRRRLGAPRTATGVDRARPRPGDGSTPTNVGDDARAWRPRLARQAVEAKPARPAGPERPPPATRSWPTPTPASARRRGHGPRAGLEQHQSARAETAVQAGGCAGVDRLGSGGRDQSLARS